MLAEGISQSISQFVENAVKKKFLKFQNNLLEGFRKDIFWDLAMPTSTAKLLKKKYEASSSDIFGLKTPNLHDP